MAIIKSEAVGNGSGSVGVFTYRFVNGETIATRRVTTNNSNTPLQQKVRISFTEFQHLTSQLKDFIQIGYIEEKRARLRNVFLAANKEYFNYLRLKSDKLTTDSALNNLHQFMTDPDSKCTSVFASYNGAQRKVDSRFFWGTNSLPDVRINHYQDFSTDDEIVLAFAISYRKSTGYYERLYSYYILLTKEDIEKLKDKREIHFPAGTFKEVDPLSAMPEGAFDVRTMAASIVVRDTLPSTTKYVAMDTRPLLFRAYRQEFIGTDGEFTCYTDTGETLHEILATQAVGASLLMVDKNGYDVPYEVKEILTDKNGLPIGMRMKLTNTGLDYEPDVYGPTLHVELRKGDTLIALVDGLKCIIIIP